MSVLLDRPQLITVAIIFIGLTLILTSWGINRNLLIHFDQGRDLLKSYEIWHLHRPTLLGPPADYEELGIYFGPLYYYLISIPLLLSGGNPVAAILLLQTITSVSYFFVYFGIERLISPQIAALTVILTSTTYSIISYSRWLSNAMPVLAIGNIFFSLIAFAISTPPQSRYRTLLLSALTLGVLWQFNPASGIGLLVFLAFLVFKSDTKIRQLPLLLGLFLLPATPQIIFEIRHNFLVTHNILNHLTNSTQGIGLSATSLIASIKSTIEFISLTLIAKSSYLIPAMTIVLILYGLIKHRSPINFAYRTIFTLVISQIGILFFLKRGSFIHFYMAIATPFVLLIILALNSLLREKLFYFVVFIFLCYQLTLDTRLALVGLHLTPIGTANLVTLGNRKDILLALEKSREDKDYTLWTYTLPYYRNEAWDYLQKIYNLRQPSSRGDILYTLYEPDWIVPSRLQSWLDQANTQSIILNQYIAGDFVLERRLWKPK